MPIVTTNQPTSTLATVLGRVVDLFQAAADATPIQVGKQYLESFGVGSAPRVLFVPEVVGQMGDPLELGEEASTTHGCDVYLRAIESADDIERLAATYDLHNRVVSALKRAGGGRLKFRNYDVQNQSTYAADLVFSFTYERGHTKDAAIYGVTRVATDTSASGVANPPPGIPAVTVDYTLTTTPS